jgi:hypothetical protein
MLSKLIQMYQTFMAISLLKENLFLTQLIVIKLSN